MTYVRTVRTGSGAVAVQIAEKRRGRRIIVEHVGSAHSDEELAVLRTTARARIEQLSGQEPLDLGVEIPVAVEESFTEPVVQDRLTGEDSGRHESSALARPAQVVSTASDLLWSVLDRAYRRLGLDAVADQVFEQVVVARIVEPTSKLAVGRVLTGLGQDPPHHTTIYRHLARAQDRDYRAVITDACHRYSAGGGEVTLVLYDVTTLYFEAENEDSLRKVGYSKERRVDPQIVVGLLVDRWGFPLQIGCFPGNKAETTTLIPIVEAYRSAHEIADMVVVADAGMLSASNLEALDGAGLRFIVGSRSVKAPSDLAGHFHWNGTAFDDGQIIDTITPRTARRKTCHPRSRRTEPVWDPAGSTDSWRAVWQYSRKRAVRDSATLTAQENRAKAVVDGDRPARKPRFVSASANGLSLDHKAIDRARQLVGLKGYVTNIPVSVMTPVQVIGAYHDLWHVEDSFRMAKSDLRARPIFHWLSDSIEAHLTTAFAALAVSRYLRQVTGLSVKRIVHTLAPLRSATLEINGSLHTIKPQTTPEARAIINAIESDAGH
ncbi:IS1634 family transposase [Acidipropionibacterium jensenii]|uniref:IS1634 family transposase n=1 Tax=Acidipropionibacterium jensenii TaxID=1749 RepID=UPI00110B057F|nr:IS1634 family transposase [Acidipropionibacterium jensenii]QCV89163.1 IS1634 family transposase [Acidipropionibacterium jensenii]